MGGEQKVDAARACVVAPGNHDGVHLGHQALLRGARELAEPRGIAVTGLTFWPHPASVISPDGGPTPLTTAERRRELMLRAGADRVVVQPFDRAFAALSPTDFLDFLQQRMGAQGVVVGPDFRFGKARAGDIALLQTFAAERGMSLKIEANVMIGGERVSSSAIRVAIGQGDVTKASRMLGHVFDVSGEVVEGDRRGRQLGFPTANVASEPVLHPADGVYAVVVRVLGATAGGASDALERGVANIGVRPTFAAGRSVEVHLFDFDTDLYGRRIRVGFVERLRGERRFASVDALRAQIEVDCREARVALSRSDPKAWALI